MRESTVPNIIADEQGFVLIVALLFLLILSIIGIIATNTSITEIQIAGNAKVHNQTFSQSDGGTEAGSNLLEENISCPAGFSGPAPLQIGAAEITANLLPAAKLNFWINEAVPAVAYPSNTQRHIRIPNNDLAPHTNLFFFGSASLATGQGIQMNAGNEGVGFGTAAGGGQLITHIDSQHIGESDSVSIVRLNWRHVIGREGTCRY